VQAFAQKQASEPGFHRSGSETSRRAISMPRGKNAVQTEGKPLDTAVRAYMEPRFGHDFSKVRVHADADASAATSAALAYTTGNHVVFGAGRYRPDTVAGRWLIAHELAHVIQQQGATPGTAGVSRPLEREANDAGMHVALGGASRISAAQGAPGLQFARVSDGGFGKALEDYTNTHSVENKAVGLLKKSTAFMALVSTLDKHYVWFEDPIFVVKHGKERDSNLKVGPDGVVTEPSGAAGMRAIKISAGGGPRFSSFGSPPDFFGFDFISIESSDTATFIDEIAHEATHASAFVSGAAPPAKTVADRVKAGIQDEIRARESEDKVLSKLPGKDIAEKRKTVASREPWEVEREVSEGLGVTYLESFFFNNELQEAQKAQKLDDAQAAKLRAEIDDLFGSVVLKPSPGYGQIWFEWKTAIKEWAEFNRTRSAEDANFTAEREKLIQDHAKRFLKGKVSYTPIPKTKP
jgi:uncharacterized protein DUF4157